MSRVNSAAKVLWWEEAEDTGGHGRAGGWRTEREGVVRNEAETWAGFPLWKK